MAWLGLACTYRNRVAYISGVGLSHRNHDRAYVTNKSPTPKTKPRGEINGKKGQLSFFQICQLLKLPENGGVGAKFPCIGAFYKNAIIYSPKYDT